MGKLYVYNRFIVKYLQNKQGNIKFCNNLIINH